MGEGFKPVILDEVSMICISNACANNLYSIAGGPGYPGDLAGWILHALTPK